MEHRPEYVSIQPVSTRCAQEVRGGASLTAWQACTSANFISPEETKESVCALLPALSVSTNFMKNERRGQWQARIFIGRASLPPRYPFINDDRSFGMPGRTCRAPRAGKQYGKRGDTR